MEKIRIACIGGWHSHAADFPTSRSKRYCSDIPHAFTACWDYNEDRGRAWAAEIGVPYAESFDRLCADPNIDAFIITSGNTRKAEHIIRAAEAGKHVFIEKSLVASNDEAYAVRDAVKKAGIHFTMSDPVMSPQIMFAKNMIEDGRLGDVVGMRVRTPHWYSLTDPDLMERFYQKWEGAGGVFYDMGTHGLHMLHYILGKPVKATGIFSRFTEKAKQRDVDDYGVAVFEFPNGAVGVAESGWVNPCGQNAFEVYGTLGFIRNDSDGLRYRLDSKGEFTYTNRSDLGKFIWVNPEDMPQEGIPCYPMRYWLLSILNDTPNEHYGIDEAVALMEMCTAAYRSDGKAVPV